MKLNCDNAQDSRDTTIIKSKIDTLFSGRNVHHKNIFAMLDIYSMFYEFMFLQIVKISPKHIFSILFIGFHDYIAVYTQGVSFKAFVKNFILKFSIKFHFKSFFQAIKNRIRRAVSGYPLTRGN